MNQKAAGALSKDFQNAIDILRNTDEDSIGILIRLEANTPIESLKTIADSSALYSDEDFLGGLNIAEDGSYVELHLDVASNRLVDFCANIKQNMKGFISLSIEEWEDMDPEVKKAAAFACENI